jgi:hypothetical protein
MRLELEPEALEMLYRHLWFFAKKSGNHIDSLHEQVLKKRQVVVTEDPNLHLVWHSQTIYLKPIPMFLLNHRIWSDHLLSQTANGPGPLATPIEELSDVCRLSLGFLRSYGYLIQHRSDFVIAKHHQLIPEDITFLQFERFIAPFRRVPDEAVANRYHFGQLRLSRLNLATRLIHTIHRGRRKIWYYHETRWTTSDYFRDYLELLFTIFVVVSLALSAMQVMTSSYSVGDWNSVVWGCWVVSTIVLCTCGLLAVISAIAVLAVLIFQAQFGIRKMLEDRKRRKGLRI